MVLRLVYLNDLQKKKKKTLHHIPHMGILLYYIFPMGVIGNRKGRLKMSIHPDHVDNLVSLRRIEGQVRGVQKMIEDRKYCIDILTQILAIKGALSRVEENILDKHLRNCVTKAVEGTSEEEKQQKMDEILKLIHQTRKG